ncbi:helix-turn-helix domain-containing protein [Paenibacillus sp. GCM10023252]|uniref:helix-turn-helix domain-containing protein n=1 Tax=Paenibacillus sp. GCM10023252 TaxID=3252649 RepID=UPI00361B5274
MDNININLIIARNLKLHRESKKLSLDKVAELTGVSKTMIGQIERGESSPTISTVWKIANGLKISFTALIQNAQPDTVVVSREDLYQYSEETGKYRVYPFFPYEEDRRFEVFTVEIDPGGFLESDAHGEGTQEFITLFEGELTMKIGDESYKVAPHHAIRFRADKPHSYHNESDSIIRMSMIIHYPQ